MRDYKTTYAKVGIFWIQANLLQFQRIKNCKPNFSCFNCEEVVLYSPGYVFLQQPLNSRI